MPCFVLILFLFMNNLAYAEECQIFSSPFDKLFAAAQVPPELWNKDLDNFENRRSIHELTARWLQKFIDNKSSQTTGLFIQGPPQSGKSHLAISFFKAMSREGHKVLYLNEKNIFNLSPSLLAQKHGITRLARYDVIILDNIPIQSRTPFGAQILAEALSLKNTPNKKILLTSTDSADEIKEKLDPLDRNPTIRHKFDDLFRIKPLLP